MNNIIIRQDFGKLIICLTSNFCFSIYSNQWFIFHWILIQWISEAKVRIEVYFLCLCVIFNWIQTQSEFVITRLTRIESLFIIFYELTQSWRFHIFRAAFWDDEWQVGGACSFSKMVVLRCLLRWDNVQRMWTVILNH